MLADKGGFNDHHPPQQRVLPIKLQNFYEKMEDAVPSSTKIDQHCHHSVEQFLNSVPFKSKKESIMSEMALKLISRAKAERWKRLDLGRTGIIGAVPEEVGELEALEELILSDMWWDIEQKAIKESQNSGYENNIQTLPSQLPSQITLLIVGKTQVTDISAIAGLAVLRYLDLSNTLVADISPISRLGALRCLKLSNTRVTEITPIAKLKSLEYLDISQTNVTDISPITLLPNLRMLDISATNVSNLEPIQGLNTLKEIDINCTEVSDISALREHIRIGLQVGFNLNARTDFIIVVGCPLTNPPMEIVSEGNAAILAYWAEQDRVGTLLLKELKLFLLGNTTAGKSTLAHALIHHQYLAKSNSTEGANLSQTWPINETTINIWDFGGQEYFHATHRLLMNDDAIYIVVADPKFNQSGYHKTPIRYADEPEPIEEDLEHFPHNYWLETIQNHAKNSPTMVLWNKLDQADLPKHGLTDADKSIFNHNIQEYPTSLKAALQDQNPAWLNKWKVFTDDLQQKITETLKDKQVIQYWPSVREAVEARSKTDIRLSYDEFEALCKADDPLRELGNIIIYLRDMCGAILYFPDHPDLKNTVFINPNKINELIYAILNRKVKKADGHFTEAHAIQQVQSALERIHNSTIPLEESEAITKEILAVMHKLKIIFPRPSTDETAFIAPQYLPLAQPKEVAFALKRITLAPAFTLHFKSYIPRFIVPNFIAQNGLFALEDGYWKLGIFYQRGTATILLQANYDTNEIQVKITPTPNHEQECQQIFQELRTLIANDATFSVSLEDPIWIDYSAILRHAQSNSQKVETTDGKFVDFFPYRWLIPAKLQQQNVDSPPNLISMDTKTLFISFSEEDDAYRIALQKHLKPHERQGRIRIISRADQRVAEDRASWLNQTMQQAAIVVILLSNDYMNDNDSEEEYQLALSLRDTQGTTLVPVIVRPCNTWEQSELRILMPANKGKAIGDPKADAAWVTVVEQLEALFATVKSHTPIAKTSNSAGVLNKNHNIPNILNLLASAFTANEFETFTLKHFPPVYQEFTPGMIQSTRITLLITHCQTKGKIDHLLELVNTENPHQYAQCGPYLG